MNGEKSQGEKNGYRFGFIGIVGRPNVGKSTLINTIVGHKLSITSRKPQTTRHRISGILTRKDCQYVFVDTPGFQTRYLSLLNRNMNRVVQGTIGTVDLVVFLVEAFNFNSWDERVLKLIPINLPTIVVLNKIDKIGDKSALLPVIAKLNRVRKFDQIFPMSAKSSLDTEKFLNLCRDYLPFGKPVYDEDEFTDKSERFLASEIIREKIFRLTGDEIPYNTTVIIDGFDDVKSNFTKIFASILVDQTRHKMMIIGKSGSKLKQIGIDARNSIEQLLNRKVYLELFVKVRTGWMERETAMRDYGYE